MFDLLSIGFSGLTPAAPLRAAPVALPVTADFGAALGAMLFPAVAPKDEGERQAPAESGKDLPDETLPDPLLAWLPAGLVTIPVPQPVPGLSLTIAKPSTGLIVEVPAPAQGTDHVIAEPVPAAVAPDGEVGLPTVIEQPTPEPESPVIAADPESPPVAAKTETPPRSRVENAQQRSAGQPRAPVVPVQTLPLAAVTPALHAFAAAIAAPVGEPIVKPGSHADSVQITAAIVATDQLRTTVQAMTAADQVPLDPSRDDWTGKMIERIVALRDSAEATDTRIRLAPENLGALEISIRRDGDRLHVHFTAENPATRQLLADAASQLVELANARGVKLGGTSVDSGTGGQPGTPQHPEAKHSTRPASAASGPEPDPNERIA